MTMLDPIDRLLIAATQAGIPLEKHPYARVAEHLGLSEVEVLARLAALENSGIIRRIALAPNHYILGMTANGMTVWDVDDAVVSECGRAIGALPFVTHCYRRPRALPVWPFNLFAMVHGSDREEVETKRMEIAKLLGDACRSGTILYSKRILKKSGFRLS
ncbi:MAG: AsnC family transcriptional regulator [Hyphomicrobium sp.]|jgi:DNA-binding Lrp family transcriptional regulator|nr:AsnC family transcriptional regulator [Hyphomicrobium sp.]